MRRWLTDRSSLTARIEQRCDRFGVKLLRQSFAVPAPDERRMIRLRDGMHCVIREVTLDCCGRSVVFAHSVLARRALRGPWRMVAGLGSSPLGAALFADPRVERYPLHFRQLQRQDVLYRRASGLLDRPATTLWARRSLFVSHGACLLVTEVFLPAVSDLAP
jgi:chorismate lyase